MNILSTFLNLIFPPICYFCRQTNENPVCLECLQQLEFIEPPFCPVCGSKTPSHQCRKFFFQSAHSVTLYNNFIKEQIYLFKYYNQPKLKIPFAYLLYSYIEKHQNEYQIDLITCVPITKTKEKQRGYNQTRLLAEEMGRKLNLPVYPELLKRVVETQSQTTLTAEERALNVKDAFCLNKDSVQGKKILLIDDVFTTGSTVNECAKVLQEKGASAIKVLTVTRARD